MFFGWSLGLLVCLFSLSLGRVHKQHPFVCPTAAKGRQYLAHNIMHRQSHQSPQCRTVTVTQAPASQDGSVRGEKQTITNKQWIMRLSATSAALGDFCSNEIDKWKDLWRRSGILPLSSISKNTFLLSSRGWVNPQGKLSCLVLSLPQHYRFNEVRRQ